MSTFTQLGVPARLASVLAAAGKDEAFPIQTATLPDSLAGRDVLGRGRTGSGKTIAFALPLVARLTDGRRSDNGPRGLVLAPTRELATQIAATIRPLADAVGLRVATVFGGVGQKPQEKAFRDAVDIIVACPGRLEDLMKQGIARLDRVEITVLDEADHMADLGFLPGVTRILTATPQGGQRMLFSATLDRGVDGLAKRFLHSPVQHDVDKTSSLPEGEMTHRVLLVDSTEEKTRLVQELASGAGRRILFTRTKHQAKKLAKQLTAAGIPAVDLHGNLSQGARDRNLASFGAEPAAGGVRVLVATDVAARGVHVDDVELVVHVDPPVEHKAYLHRSGRTARAGASGTVVTVGLTSQARDVASLLRAAAIRVQPENVTADARTVDELVGERAPRRHVSVAAPVQNRRPSGKRTSAPDSSASRPARSGSSDRGRRSRGGATRDGQDAAAQQNQRKRTGSRGTGTRSTGASSSVVWSSDPRVPTASATPRRRGHRRASTGR